MDDRRPSATALMVALSMLRRGSRYALPAAVIDGAAQALRSASWGWRSLQRLAVSAPGRRLLDRVERALLPGMADHHCARKRWIAGRLRAAPISQRWLWLGSGFDCSGRVLAHELAAEQAIHLFELDHPASRRLQWSETELQPRSHSLDFRWPDDTDTLLRLLDAEPSTLVLEGVAMYWSSEDLLSCLQQICQLTTPPRLLFTALAPQSTSIAVGGWLRLQREPFRWRETPEQLIELLQGLGYQCRDRWQGPCFGEFGLDLHWQPGASRPAARTGPYAAHWRGQPAALPA